MKDERGTILVVDDEALNRLLLKTSLEQEGYAVETAADGREALARLGRGNYDAVLLDLLMPEVDGYQVLAEMKQSTSLRHVPVIVISALDEMDSVIRCIENGATDYLPKPFDPVLLRARLNASLAEKRMHDMQRAYTAEIETLAEQLKLRNRFIQETFGRYLSDEIVATLLESPGGLDLGGQKRRVTILMSDLRGFSKIAERLAPEQVVQMVNNYLGAMADVILEHDGMINDFIGDSVLGLFGAPLARSDDAARAVRCAVAMQLAMEQVNETNRRDGLPELEMGIAVHTGELVVGNIGSAKRAKYGAIGSHVNLASRIESYTVGGQVLVSEATIAEAGPDVVVGEELSIRAKGFQEAIMAYDLKGIGGAAPLLLDRREARPRPCHPPLRVKLTRLDGKHLHVDEQVGALVEISEHHATISGHFSFAPYESVRLLVQPDDGLEPSGEAYAKVLPPTPEASGTTSLRFTAVPTEILAIVQARATAPHSR